MTLEQIMEMASKANLPACHLTHPKALQRFADLVAQYEREECAKVCEELEPEWADQPDFARVEELTMLDCSIAIQGRQWL
jgi:hypothetical protein